MTDNFARLLALMGAGGSGGTKDYEALTNKPSINGTTLIGDVTLAELGIIVDDQLSTTSTNPVQNAVLTALLNAFPYANITGKPQINGITLTGNVTLSQLGLNAIWVGTRVELTTALANNEIADGTLIFLTDEPDVDNLPTQNSANLVYSGGVWTALQDKENIFRVAIMPQASQTYNGMILQFIGTTTGTYTNGFYYECVATTEGGTTTYTWVQKNVQPQITVDSGLSELSENPIQNKVVSIAIHDLEDRRIKDVFKFNPPQSQSFNSVTLQGIIENYGRFYTSVSLTAAFIVPGTHISVDNTNPSYSATFAVDSVEIFDKYDNYVGTTSWAIHGYTSVTISLKSYTQIQMTMKLNWYLPDEAMILDIGETYTGSNGWIYQRTNDGGMTVTAPEDYLTVVVNYNYYDNSES